MVLGYGLSSRNDIQLWEMMAYGVGLLGFPDSPSQVALLGSLLS